MLQRVKVSIEHLHPTVGTGNLPVTCTSLGRNSRSPGLLMCQEGALATVPMVRAVQTLGISGDPPGDNCDHQGPPGKNESTQKPLGFIGNH